MSRCEADDRDRLAATRSLCSKAGAQFRSVAEERQSGSTGFR